MSEVAPAGGGPNRLFIILALGLVGLLLIGIVALIVFVFVIQPMLRPAAAPPTPTRVVLAAATPTRAPLPTATNTLIPTNTPLPTATLVVQPPTGGGVTPVGGATATATVATTATLGPGTGTPTGGLPDTGIGENLLLLAAGIVLVLVIFAARRARAVT